MINCWWVTCIPIYCILNKMAFINSLINSLSDQANSQIDSFIYSLIDWFIHSFSSHAAGWNWWANLSPWLVGCEAFKAYIYLCKNFCSVQKISKWSQCSSISSEIAIKKYINFQQIGMKIWLLYIKNPLIQVVNLKVLCSAVKYSSNAPVILVTVTFYCALSTLLLHFLGR